MTDGINAGRFTQQGSREVLKVLISTNDPVAISLAETLLRDSGISHVVLDQHMSTLEGSVGILPRRLVVGGDDLPRARRLMQDAGLASYLAEVPGNGD